jgi:UDP-N-acetylmuramoylalanine--D-glutamate ligase
VTGTNGKTTTTSLVTAILQSAGRPLQTGGNIGQAVSSVVPKLKKGDDLVLEVSSYQLEDSAAFHPRRAALLNITPDHIDHHGTYAAYVRAKARLFAAMGPKDVCVFNADDAEVKKLARSCKAKKLFFGWGRGVDGKITPEGLELKIGARKAKLRPPQLLGGHNLENAAAAALMAFSARIPAAKIQAAFDAFKGVEHRLEKAGEIGGVLCVNDSKATNVDSTRVALRAFEARGKKLWVILGGLDKGAPYEPLGELLRATAKGVLTIGSAADKIEKELGRFVPIHPCGAMDAAIDKGLELAEAGDVLLLSPACASFDQFKDYEHRGRVFKDLVRLAAQERKAAA